MPAGASEFEFAFILSGRGDESLGRRRQGRVPGEILACLQRSGQLRSVAGCSALEALELRGDTPWLCCGLSPFDTGRAERPQGNRRPKVGLSGGIIC